MALGLRSVAALVFCTCLALASQEVSAAEQRHEPWSVFCLETRGFHDGDTMTCVSGPQAKGTFVVRFAGIDAPETGQANWRLARDKLREIAVPGTLAECYKQDQYGRQVCRMKSANGNDLADAMLADGLVWHAVRFADEQTFEERERYAKLEQRARAAKLGLWAQPEPMPPGVCRQVRKKHQKCR